MDIPILMYHHIRPPGAAATPYSIPAHQFAKQLQSLHDRRYRAITLAQLFDALADDQQSLCRCVVITFDDGYESFRTVAVPLLQKYQMTATVFAVAGELGRWNRWDDDRGMPQLALMTEGGVREVLSAGMELGAHGWQHRDMTCCGIAECEEEAVRSKSELESRFDVSVRAFAYPHGRFNSAARSAVKAAGYEGAVSIFSQARSVTADRFAMRRVYVHDSDNGLTFRLKTTVGYLRFAAWRGNPTTNKSSAVPSGY